jgi:predicted SAM-dependent methyltransferase
MTNMLEKKSLIPKSKKCNLGCGDTILEGWVNVDKFNPRADIKADVLDLPFADGIFDEVILSHVIEHIPYRKHLFLLDEIHRVMEYGGKLSIGFPDFMLTAKAFLENKGGERWTWWVQTLYGMQIDEGQFHVAPVTTDHLVHQLQEAGFEKFEINTGDFNVLITCYKTEPLPWHTEEGSCRIETGLLV